MFQNSGFQSGPSKGVRLSFLTQADQAKFEQLFAQSAGPYGGSKIPAQTVSDLLRRSNLDNDTLAKIWDLSSIANAPHLTFPEFAVAMFLTSKKLTGQALPASLPPDVREETEIAMATIESTETSRQLVSTSTPPIQPQQQFMNQQLPMMTGMPPQMTSIQPQMTSMQPQMTSMQPQMPMMTGRPTPPPVPQLPMQTGFSNNFQTPMQTGFQPSQPPTKPRLQNLDFAKKMMPNQSGVTNLLNPNLGTKDSERISWKISPEEKQRYREIFDAWDGTGTGFMSGETAKDVLTQSQLPPEDLMKIWTLADSDNKGSLDNDEFAIAMHLVYRKLNGFEIPSVLPPELRPPSSVLKKFVIGRRAPSAMPSFGSPPARREENEDSLYGNNQHDYVSSSRRKGPPPSVSARSSSNYSSLDQEEDARVLEDLRRQISDTQRQLNRMPKVTTSSSYSNKYSLEELKEKIRRAHEDLHHATRTNHLSSKYFENKETLLGLIETQKSLQDEIQYLCNRDIPVLARQLRSSAAELRDAKVRNSRKTDTAQDYMAYVQPTGPGGSITESDRVRAKAKAMMAARKAGSTGSSSDASFVLRRAEEEKEEIDRRADTIERDMEKARTSLLDMRGDLKYLEEMTAAKDLEDKKRFDNGQDLSYELRRFIEQLDTKTTELGSYARAPDNFRSSAASSPALSTSGYQSPSMGASSPALSSPAPKPSPVRPRTAEEIKKEAERRVQERLAAIQAKRNPGSSPRISAPSTSFAASPTNNKPNESEAEAERAAQEMLRASVNQREELDRKKREADLERMREDERLERQRQEQREREKAEEEQRARIQQEEDEKRREQEDREFEERRRQRLAKEEADRQARFDAIKRHEEEEEAKKAQDTSYKPEEAPASESTPPPVSEPSAAPNAISTNNPFAKFQQSTTAEPSSPQTEKPNEPASKRVSYNPFAAFSAFSATKGGNQDDSDSDDDDGWDVTHNDSEDENEFPAAGSAKNLAGMLFDAMSKRNDNDVPQEASRKPDVADTSVPSPPPPPAPPAPIPPPAPASNQADSTPSIPPATGGDMRSALLSQIQLGKTLKKTTTNDRSSSSIAGRVVGDASTPSTSSAPEPVSTTSNNAPLSSSGFLAELQSRTGGGDSSPNEPSQANVATHAPNTVISQDDTLPETEYVAVWDYTGAGSDDLSFSQDDVILVRDNNESEDWWYGTLQSNGEKGYFPRNYVQLKPEAVPNLNIKAKALYDFEGPEGQGCLDLKMGDTVVVLVKENNDWWKAQSEDGTRVGLVPANYLEEQA